MRYSVDLRGISPTGYRWANNLKVYSAVPEAHRFTGYFDSMGAASGELLAQAHRVM